MKIVFSNEVVNEVIMMWQELKIVHGKPWHSQSQYSIEKSNRDIEKMICTIRRKWSDRLRFIQFIKNGAYHSEINCSPYKVMFGCNVYVRLNTYL